MIATIRSQPGDFDTRPEALIALKDQYVPDSVIQAIVDKPSRTLGIPAGGSTSELVLADGSEVTLRLRKDLSSATARAGDRIEFEVVEDIAIDGVVVIAKGAPARGEVVEASKKKSFGRKGKLDFTIDAVEAVDGQNVRLRTTREAQGDDQYGKAAVITILTGPFGWFVKGKDIVVPAGEEYTIYIDGDRRISLRPSPVTPTGSHTAAWSRECRPGFNGRKEPWFLKRPLGSLPAAHHWCLWRLDRTQSRQSSSQRLKTCQSSAIHDRKRVDRHVRHRVDAVGSVQSHGFLLRP